MGWRERSPWGKALPPAYKARSREELRQCQMIYQMADTALNPRLRLRDLIGEKRFFSTAEQALERIERHHYGKCLHCGQEISSTRLEVLPFARFCVPCQEKMESKGH